MIKKFKKLQKLEKKKINCYIPMKNLFVENLFPIRFIKKSVFLKFYKNYDFDHLFVIIFFFNF